MRGALLSAAAAFGAALPVSVWAEAEHAHEAQATTGHAINELHHEAGPHHFSVLAGITDNEEHTAFTLGIDYEYRLGRLLGIGAVLEQAFGDIDATTVLAVADLHVWRGLAVQTGPGVEFIDHAGETDEEFVYRIGVLYEFEQGAVTISPQLHLDLTSEGESVVLGVAFGFGFGAR